VLSLKKHRDNFAFTFHLFLVTVVNYIGIRIKSKYI